MKKDALKKSLIEETAKIDVPISNQLASTQIQTKQNLQVENQKKHSFKLYPLLTSLACCLVLICLCFVFIPNNQTQLTSYILKINPEFCITTDQNNNVVSICSLNDDADDVLDNSAFDNIVGTKFADCVALIINNVDENIFQNYGNKRIALYALNDNQNTMDQKLSEFGDIVRQNLDERGYVNIQFDTFDMTLDFFKDKMGFENDFNNLDDMRKLIEQHNKFFDQNHLPPPR